MAKGSEMSKKGYEHVKVCATCGGKLVLAMGAQYETDVLTGVARGWHASCSRPQDGA